MIWDTAIDCPLLGKRIEARRLALDDYIDRLIAVGGIKILVDPASIAVFPPSGDDNPHAQSRRPMAIRMLFPSSVWNVS